MIHRFCIKGPRTGANNPSLMRVMLTESAVFEGLALPIKLLAVVIYFLAIIAVRC
jgi:hypothetical protein